VKVLRRALLARKSKPWRAVQAASSYLGMCFTACQSSLVYYSYLTSCSIVGHVLRSKPLMVVMSALELGNLRDYLRQVCLHECRTECTLLKALS
jgi:hypothetical protein